MKKIQAEWNLKQLYLSPTDPLIEKDIRSAEQAIEKFRTNYYSKKADFKKPGTLLVILEKYKKFFEHPGLVKTAYYISLNFQLNSFDEKVQQRMYQIDERITKALNNLSFVQLRLGALDKKTQKSLLQATSIKKYSYFLKQIFDQSEHMLSEDEENILSLKKQTSYDLWTEGVQKFLAKQEIELNGTLVPLDEAVSSISNLSTKKRRELFKKVYAVFEKGSDFAESELNAVIIDKKITDELRGFKKPYSSTVLSFENTGAELEAVTQAVSGDYKTSKKFYTLKKKALGLKDMEYADKDVSIGKISTKFTFEESVKILRKAFRNFDPVFEDIFNRMLESEQISAFPKKGKMGGAFCAGAVNVPTYVFLNHTNDFRSLRTFAHEMGHAFHSELSKKQDVLYQDYPISIAEVASTFFEKVVMNEVAKGLTKKEKIVLFHDRISDEVSTIYRQVSAFNFELELHNMIRKEGFQSKEKIGAMLIKHLRAYLGSDVLVPDVVGNLFVYWSHFRRFFYVYTYAYGCIVSNALYAKYVENPSIKKDIINFLSSGGSVSPREIFKRMGIDTEKKETYTKGLSVISQEIKTLEQLLS